VRIAIEVRHGPVERVEHPPAAALADGARALLGEQPVLRALAQKEIADQRFSIAIGVRDEVGGARLRVDTARRPSEALREQRARRAGDPLGEDQV
jgi:hypothetical protein